MKRNRSFVQISLICIVCTLLETCSSIGSSPHPDLNQVEVPDAQRPIDIADLVTGQAPSYRGIAPGASHKQDVLAQWGQPNTIRVYGEYESLHYFEVGVVYVLVKDDIVQAVTSNARQYQPVRNGYPATLDDMSQVLQTPNVFTSTLCGPVWVFGDYGLAYSYGEFQFFVPMSFHEYTALWGELGPRYDPFPPTSSVEAVGIRPGETTRNQVAQLLGNPDYIAFEDHNAPWSYNAEQEMLGYLSIFFDDDNVVEHMNISPISNTPQVPVLEDIVNQYGQPDVLQLMPGLEGQKYETLALLYPDRGLRVAAKCTLPTCEVVKRNARVVQKWYFRPTLVEYQKEFSSQDPAYESAYVDWHGFDE